MTRIPVSCSQKCVAKLFRNVCGATRFLIPAPSAAAWMAQRNWRVTAARPDCARGTASLPAARRQAAAPRATRRAALRAFAARAWRGDPCHPCLLDSQQHAPGVDIADLEGDDFRDAQTG